MNKSKMLTIITYNIHSGKNLWLTPQLSQIIKFLKNLNPDIIGIQEIHENKQKGYQVNLLKNQLKLESHFGPNLEIYEGNFGIATFTNLPMLECKHFLLPRAKEQRGFIDTKIKLGNTYINIVNTHLSLYRKKRRQQFYELKNYLMKLESPYILLGDFNTTSPELEGIDLYDSAKEMKKEHLPTAMLSNQRIDYIFLTKHFKILNYEVYYMKMSDHYPVVVDVILNN